MTHELTEASDEELVDRARAGEDHSIEVLLDRYRHYARAKARLYFIAGADSEDLIQEGMIGLYKAIRDFEESRNIAFRAFAELCITRQIITAIKGATRQKHLPLNTYVSLQRPMTSENGDETPLADILMTEQIQDPADLVIASEEIAVLRSSMATVLSSMESEVLQLYIDGKSYQQIADVLGRRVKSIDNALQRIKRKLEQHVSGNIGLRLPQHAGDTLEDALE